MRILVVEGDEFVAKALEVALGAVADIDIITNGVDALHRVDESYYDLIILDVLLPDMSGIEVLNAVRKAHIMPIIVLSQLSDLNKKVECLNLGADDYMTKPFSQEELVARIQALLRRVNSDFSALNYKRENYEINYGNKMFMVDGNYIEMNRKTYEILELLVRNKDMIMTKQQIFDRIWGYYSNTVPTVVEINIFRLRRILAEFDLDTHLKTIKSTGYMWVDTPIISSTK